MTQTYSRTIQIGDWCFELKSVRALKSDEYGKPYTAIANCNINGNTMYVDGLLTKNDEAFDKKDFASFYKFCQQIGIDNCNYHRFDGFKWTNKSVNVMPDNKGKYAKQIESTISVEQADSKNEQLNMPAMRLVK